MTLKIIITQFITALFDEITTRIKSSITGSQDIDLTDPYALLAKWSTTGEVKFYDNMSLPKLTQALIGLKAAAHVTLDIDRAAVRHVIRHVEHLIRMQNMHD